MSEVVYQICEVNRMWIDIADGEENIRTGKTKAKKGCLAKFITLFSFFVSASLFFNVVNAE